MIGHHAVHVIADAADKRAVLQAMLQERHTVTSESLGQPSEGCGEAEAVVIEADLRSVENVAILRKRPKN